MALSTPEPRLLAGPVQTHVHRANRIRLSVWLFISVTNLQFFPASHGLPAILAAGAALASLIPFWQQRAYDQRAGRVGVLMDLLFSAGLVTITGGSSSPYYALNFVVVGEAFCLSGPAAGVRTAACLAVISGTTLVRGVGPGEIVSYVIAASLLVLSAAILTMAKRPADPPKTLFPPRSSDELEHQLHMLEERYRRIHGVYQQAATAIRQQNAALRVRDTTIRLLEQASAEGRSSDQLERVLRVLMDAFDAAGAALWIADASGKQLDLHAAVGAAEMLDPEPILITDLASDIRGAVDARCAPISSPASTVPYSERSSLSIRRENALVGKEPDDRRTVLPLLVHHKDKLLAAIGLSYSRAGKFDEEAPQRLTELLPALTTAIAGIQTVTRLQARLRDAAIVRSLERLSDCGDSTEAIYRDILDRIADVIVYENSSVYSIETPGPAPILIETRGRQVNLLDNIDFRCGSGAAGWVATNLRPLIVPDLKNAPRLFTAEQVPPGIRSVIVLPLMVNEQLAAVLSFSHSRPYAFLPDDVESLKDLIDAAGRILERRAETHLLQHVVVANDRPSPKVRLTR